MAEARTHWQCICGRRWPLTTTVCHADDCEEPRAMIEDEDALPMPAVPGSKEARMADPIDERNDTRLPTEMIIIYRRGTPPPATPKESTE